MLDRHRHILRRMRSYMGAGPKPTGAYVDGGYPLVAYIGGETLCPNCLRSDWNSIVRNVLRGADAGVDVYWEGPPLSCDVCCADFKSAYGDPVTRIGGSL